MTSDVGTQRLMDHLYSISRGTIREPLDVVNLAANNDELSSSLIRLFDASLRQLQSNQDDDNVPSVIFDHFPVAGSARFASKGSQLTTIKSAGNHH
jgi:hypothetical protein